MEPFSPPPAMDTPLSSQEFALLCDYIETESGIALGEEKAYLLESRLRHLLGEAGVRSYGELYRMVKTGRFPVVRQRIIDAITTNETLWFRDRSPYVVLEEYFLPRAVELIRRGRVKIRIWSAACSTGQEPYSVAIVVRNYLDRLAAMSQDVPATPAHFEIVATDISDEALSVARLGAYDQYNMGRGMDEANVARWFKKNQRYWIIDPSLKHMIQFRQFNLQDDFSPLGAFDCILCRNVAIYFSHQTKTWLFQRMRRVLHPHGILLLGSTESLSYYSRAFRPLSHKNHVFYVPSDGPEA